VKDSSLHAAGHDDDLAGHVARELVRGEDDFHLGGRFSTAGV